MRLPPAATTADNVLTESNWNSLADLLNNTLVDCTDNNSGKCFINQASKSALDNDLAASNIKSGVTIFGVAGTYTGEVGSKANGEICSSDGECISGNCYVDTDGDRYAVVSGTKKCQANSLIGTDCNDSNASFYQLLTCYNDGDGDSYGAGTGSSVCATSCGTGKSTSNADCLDTDAQVNPAAGFHTTQHSTRGWDWNCDGQITKLNDDTAWYESVYNCTTCSVSGSSSLCPTCPSANINVSCAQISFDWGQYKGYNVCRANRGPWAASGYCGEDSIWVNSTGNGPYKSAQLEVAGYTESCK
ncbi:MAG: hypothetical protein PHZ04_04220 [Patescibacteria group bacterium]|nr:hypothetical protein [Patescibacteria group bacterium]MDD5554467.1 hypothetical protein [Patescibacteria group bacterium]